MATAAKARLARALSFLRPPLATLDLTPRLPRAEAAIIGSTAMRSILAAIAVLLCASVSAAEIPSAASGAYVAPDRLCRLVLSRAGANHIDVDLLCVTDAGVPTSALIRAEAWAGRCIGAQFTASVFPLSGSSPMAGFVALDAFAGNALQVRRAADPGTLYNGGGAAEAWTLVRSLPSPAPYTCGKRPSSGVLRK